MNVYIWNFIEGNKTLFDLHEKMFTKQESISSILGNDKYCDNCPSFC